MLVHQGLMGPLGIVELDIAPRLSRATFTTSDYPDAAGACYVALWQLPRPDFHLSACGHAQTFYSSCQVPGFCASSSLAQTLPGDVGQMVILIIGSAIPPHHKDDL